MLLADPRDLEYYPVDDLDEDWAYARGFLTPMRQW
jgi:hypothetical protein